MEIYFAVLNLICLMALKGFALISTKTLTKLQWGLEYRTRSEFGWSTAFESWSKPFEIRTWLAQVILYIFFSFYIKRPRLMRPFCFFDHSKTELWRPFCSVFEWSYQPRPFYTKKKLFFIKRPRLIPFEIRTIRVKPTI